MAENCEHKYIHKSTDSYWRFCGRNNREYYQVDTYYCEKCLNEKVKEKRHTCYDSEVWNIPEWAKLITKKIQGYE